MRLYLKIKEADKKHPWREQSQTYLLRLSPAVSFWQCSGVAGVVADKRLSICLGVLQC